MSKYDGLGEYLTKQNFDEVPMTFAEIERAAGTSLPPKAQHHRAWWSNNPANNVMTKVWLDAGFETSRVDIVARKLVFRRIARANKQQGGGMSDVARDFHRTQSESEKQPRRHPAFGALKGTFTIEPGWDLTRPSMDPEELDEMEANLERTADMVEKGLSGARK
jgi:hypothetical protein